LGSFYLFLLLPERALKYMVMLSGSFEINLFSNIWPGRSNE